VCVRVQDCTVEDSLLVRKDANVLSQRLGQGYGHLICLAILTEEGRRKERKRENREIE
jgi:hypothetical protein